MRGTGRASIRAAFVGVFYVSGFCALLYQILWQRILTLFGGADLESVTVIVAAFMLGLGAGSLAGGALADALGHRARIRAFAACELAIAVFAVASPYIYYDFLYGRLGDVGLPRLSLGLIAFVVTLFPTTCMGMSLPLASRIVTDDVREPARWVPILYGWNTIGAASGALCAVAVLFSTVSFSTSIRIGAVLSAGCGLVVLLLGRDGWRPGLQTRQSGGTEVPPSTSPGSHVDSAATGLTWWHWVGFSALSGLVALSLEMIWFRVLGVIIKSNGTTFGYLLTTYLLGIGLGALAANSRWTKSWRPAQSFLLVQAAIPALAALAVIIFSTAVAVLPSAAPLRTYLSTYETFIGFGRFGVLLYAIVPFWLMGLPTIMMGLSFGLLQRSVQVEVNRLGRRVGWLQAANVVGSTAGAVVTGLFLLDRWGVTGSLVAMMATSVVYLWQLRRREFGVRGAAAAIALIVVVAIGAMPSPSTLWSRLHGVSPESAIVAEDRTGISVLVPDGDSTVMFTNGLGQSSLPYGDVHTALGALPILLHPSPVRVGIIGLGSGDTVFAAGGRAETTRIDVIEIVRPAFTALGMLEHQGRYRGLHQLLADRRVTYDFTDGRAFLRRGTGGYDVIEADALRPRSAYAGNLYSVEYFTLLKNRLAPGGLAVTWTPTERVRDTFISVFPYVLVFGDIAIGSATAITWNAEAVQARMREARSSQYYRDGDVEIEAVLREYLRVGPEYFDEDFDRASLVDLNRDLFPKDEFGVGRKR